MSFESELAIYITQALPDLTVYRGFLPQLPQAASYPCVVIQQITRIGETILAGYSGLTSDRVQFDCWGLIYGDAITQADNLRTTFDGLSNVGMGSYAVSALRVNQMDFPPLPVNAGSNQYRYKTVVEFKFWWQETIPVHPNNR